MNVNQDNESAPRTKTWSRLQGCQSRELVSKCGEAVYVMRDKLMMMKGRRVRTERYRLHEVRTDVQVKEHENFVNALKIIKNNVEAEKKDS